MIFVIAIHSIICVTLIILVLIQRGRGGGLVESFQGVESMFGTKTNEFLTRTTTILSILFFITCVSLALLSVKQSRSLLRNVKPEAAAQKPIPQEQTNAAIPVAPQEPPVVAPATGTAKEPVKAE